MATPKSYWSGMVADPTITRSADGILHLDWDDNAPIVCLATRELLVEVVAQLNARKDKP